ncbi:MAG: cell envelope integrity protein TolA [Archangium sp.]|nr:cell envelope integrity protein TolA [Archangium sp.]
MVLAFALAVLTAAKPDAALVGTWTLAGEPFMTLNANGSGVMDGEKLSWRTNGATVSFMDGDGEEDRAGYAVQGDALTLTLNGVPLQLQRAGKGAAVKAKGSMAKKLEAAQAKQAGGSDDAEAEAMASAQAWLQAQQGGAPGGAVRGQQGQAQAPQARRGGGAAGNDQLSQLLVSSNWCYLRYASGNTYTQKIHFSPDGTWNDFSESDIHVNNSIGIAQATGNRQNGGQWAVQGGQLMMSDPPETPQLAPVPLTITRNSNGYPILNADGREYSMCQ